MFCPVCESEFDVGIKTCPDDGTPLVSKLTPENTMHDHSEARFVPLHTFGSPAEAEMVNDIFVQKRSFVPRYSQEGKRRIVAGCFRLFSNGQRFLLTNATMIMALELYQSFFGDDPNAAYRHDH